MPTTINKARLSELLSEKVGISKKEADAALSTFVEIVKQTLKEGGEVNIAGFGAFSARVRKGRAGVNPQNKNEKIIIPSVTVPKFKAGKRLKDALKKPTSAPAPAPAAPATPPSTPSVPATPSAPLSNTA